MKISELAAASGESIPTIKYYIRQGLLPAGEVVGKNRADYSERHKSRLDLIRLLQEELNMSLERIAEILSMESQGGNAMLGTALSAARDSQHKDSSPRSDQNLEQAKEQISKMVAKLGWQHREGDLAFHDVERALATILRVLPQDDPETFLEDYARAMKAIADEEIPETFDPAGEPWESLRYAVLGTYLYEPLILALRRMAHGQRSWELERARAAPRVQCSESQGKSESQG